MSPFDLVRQLKPLYSPSAKHPSIVEAPELAFLMIDGRGDPASSERYQEALLALYGIAYTLKLALRRRTRSATSRSVLSKGSGGPTRSSRTWTSCKPIAAPGTGR